MVLERDHTILESLTVSGGGSSPPLSCPSLCFSLSSPFFSFHLEASISVPATDRFSFFAWWPEDSDISILLTLHTHC